MSRSALGLAFAAAAIAIGVACSSSDDKGSSSSSGGSSGASTSTSGSAASAFKTCAPSTATNCAQSDLDAYTSCLVSKCDSGFQICYGASYKSGAFGGPCGQYVTCTQKCACGDKACLTKCGTTPSGCTSCLGGLTCTQQCPTPACYTAGTSSSSSSSSSSGSTGPFTCAQLTTCCKQVPAGSEQTICNNIANDKQDSSCNDAYPGFSAQAADGGCP